MLPNEMSSLCDELGKLMVYSATDQTWAKHCSAWHLYNKFCLEFLVKNQLPVPVEYARAFVTWAVTKKGLKSSTVQSYVSSLKTAHVIGNYKCQNFSSDPCIKMALKGAENMYQIFNTPKADRLPMNIHLLDILGDRISALGWSVLSKQVLWTACTISFFTSCRMGELLPLHEKLFEQKTTLLWGNVKFISDNEILIRIPYSKANCWTSIPYRMIENAR